MIDVEEELTHLCEKVQLKKLLSPSILNNENWSSYELWAIFGDDIEQLIQACFSSKSLKSHHPLIKLQERLAVVEQALSYASMRGREVLKYSIVEKFISPDEKINNIIRPLLLSNTAECYEIAINELGIQKQWLDNSGKILKY